MTIEKDCNNCKYEETLITEQPCRECTSICCFAYEFWEPKEERPNHSCLTCKHETKDICEEPCMDCNITLGNDKWEEKNEQS